MKVDEILDLLDEDRSVSEGYVLVRELQVSLDVGHERWHPLIKIKIYKVRLGGADRFHFDVSHHVHTPTQADPYYTSRTVEDTEADAIRRAISSTETFLRSAIREGHEPANKWLVPNPDF